ncbi:2,3-bisphosphoglycerate-independent phosphoglycerate mutase [Methanosarcinaceae archaeon Ag5]|uniref:2,3-bisphosphoglycerate-independent phosphoglycerate mutase n=1 Tax=Methanolapillus africanus TaxID=3028297 RepID=A0AAE4MK50_9EURY|nr:2,3-bisphosphoglycerate-independent phosphoglycerate mutase [Methanosarcinaceae archaeon Ag5]
MMNSHISKNNPSQKSPLLLMILDGWGFESKHMGNAVAAANTPNLDFFEKHYPTCLCEASGIAVGLPAGQMGNSEVGHLNMGAGRVIYQDLTLINKEIEDGTFFKNPTLLSAIENAKTKKSALHLMGLVSYGGVHSSLNHLKALLLFAKREGLSRDQVFVHAFLDGRDVAPKSAMNDLEDLENFMTKEQIGKLSTIMGRYYAMDRDKRWERTQAAYDVLTAGKPEIPVAVVDAADWKKALQASFDKGETDEFVKPIVLMENAKRVSVISDNDSVIFFNFRPDRARQLTYAMTLPDNKFSGFTRKVHPNVFFVCMTQYDEELDVPIAYPPKDIKNTLGEYLSSCGIRQLRIAETEKYAHVTFFFNGGVEEPNPDENRILIPSPKVATYDEQPEMSAYIVTERLLEAIDEDKYDFIVLNFANMDMVGHTGIFEAATKAVETVDECAGVLVEKILEKGGAVIITADHGNAEQMLDDNKKPHTAHTTNPVKIIYVDEKNKKDGKAVCTLRDGGKLCDIAPTLLEIMDLEIPAEMTGQSLLKK